MGNKTLAEEWQEELDTLNIKIKLLKDFPDLHKSIDRWSRVRLYSKQANAQTNDVDINHNCGCCNDSPLEARPFILINNIKVFSDPDRFTVGQKVDYGCGDKAYDDWQNALRKENIPEIIIEKIQEYFTENPPKYYTSEDEDDLDING